MARCLPCNHVAGPALVAVLRGLDAFRHLESMLCPTQPSVRSPGRSLEHIMSPTAELAFRLAALFFSDDELYADDEARPLLPYLPPTPQSKTTQVTGGFSRAQQ